VGADLRTILRIFYWVFAVLVITGASVAWWFIYRPLPQIDGSVLLPGLRQEVTVERDAWGVPHIRAATVEDLAEAQGYVMAQDRLWQMDLLRRVARGNFPRFWERGPSRLMRAFERMALREPQSATPRFSIPNPAR